MGTFIGCTVQCIIDDNASVVSSPDVRAASPFIAQYNEAYWARFLFYEDVMKWELLITSHLLGGIHQL